MIGSPTLQSRTTTVGGEYIPYQMKAQTSAPHPFPLVGFMCVPIITLKLNVLPFKSQFICLMKLFFFNNRVIDKIPATLNLFKITYLNFIFNCVINK